MRFTIYFTGLALAVGILAWKLCYSTEGSPTILPNLAKQWHDQVYALDADEIIRFVAPPFSPEQTRSSGFRFSGGTGQVLYRTDEGPVRQEGWSISTGTVESAVSWCIDLPGPELELAENVAALNADGDWIMRSQAPIEQRAHALASILSTVTRKELRIENLGVERELIIIRGRWSLKASSNQRPILLMAFDDHLEPWYPFGGSIGDFLRQLSRFSRCKVIDETQEPRPKQVYWRHAGILGTELENTVSREQALTQLMRDTTLEFVTTRRRIPVWFVHGPEAMTQAKEK